MKIESSIGKETVDLSWLFPIRGLEHSEVVNRRRRLIECISPHFERSADCLCLSFPERWVWDNDTSLSEHVSPRWEGRAYLPRHVYHNRAFNDRSSFWYFLLEGLLERYEGVGVMVEDGILNLEFSSDFKDYRIRMSWPHPAFTQRPHISLKDVTPKPEDATAISDR